MPQPNKGESKKDYMARCIPILVGEGKDQDQAVAICSSMYNEFSDEGLFWIEVFKAGKHTATNGNEKEYTEDDLDQIASKYNEQTEHEAPLVVGHPETNGPAFGWTAKLKRDGAKLLAGVKQVAQEIIEANRAGHYKKVSISLYADGLLRHIGLLGATPPAVKGLAAVSFAADREFSEWVWTTDEWRVPMIGRIFQRMRDYFISMFGVETADKIISTGEIEQLVGPLESKEIPIQNTSQIFSEKEEQEMKEAFDKLQKDFAELKESYETLKVSFAKQDEELTAIKDERAREQNDFAEKQRKLALDTETSSMDSFLEVLIAEGKVLSGEKEALMSEFSDIYRANTKLDFASGEKDLVTKFKDRLTGREKVIQKSGDFANPHRAKKPVDVKDLPASFANMEVTPDGLEFHNQAVAYMAEHKEVTYEQAIREVTK